MGVVYRASNQSRSLGRGKAPPTRAIRARIASNGSARGAVAGVAAPKHCRIYEVGEHDAQSFLAMEFVEGKISPSFCAPATVGRAGCRVRALPRRSDSLCTRSGRSASRSQAVKRADRRSRRVRVTDFGLAKNSTAAATSRSRQLFGTPNYLSPKRRWPHGEVGRQPHLCDRGVLYELLTGRPPFLASRCRKHYCASATSSPWPRARSTPACARPRDNRLKCLEKSPIRRYASLRHWQGPRAWLRREPIEARPITKIERGWKWARRNPAPRCSLALRSALRVHR